MQLHQITRTHPHKASRRIGRGGKRGGYSGRGIKGQRARAGAKIRPAIRDIVKKIPKQRGYKFRSFRKKPFAVNVGDLERVFPAGARITLKDLLVKGLLERHAGKLAPVKILGKGVIKKPLTLVGLKVSESVKAKIVKAGGKVI